METLDRYQRWRLILGKRVEEELAEQRAQAAAARPGGQPGHCARCGEPMPDGQAAGEGSKGRKRGTGKKGKQAGGEAQPGEAEGEKSGTGAQPGGPPTCSRCSGGKSGAAGLLSGEMARMDNALAAIYDAEQGGMGSRQSRSGSRKAGLGAGAGTLATWLGDIRRYFEQDVVVLIQQDAIERRGLQQLLFEPEMLSQVTPSVELVATLLTLKQFIPEQTKETARQVVAAVVEEIRKRLQAVIEQAVRGALDRSRHQPLPSLPNIDWQRTIRRNLKNYIPERRVIVPERFYFYARQQRRREWNIIVCMDQSGSMADSVVYGSVMGAICASIPALEAHVVAFDTEVVDLTANCSDPVDVLFGVQLGGGTDINRAVRYCRGLVHDPRRTVFILISDLYEGGVEAELVKRMEEMVAEGTRAVCLLALSDSGAPSFDARIAKRLRNVGVPSFACTPGALPDLLAAALKGHDLEAAAARFSKLKFLKRKV